MINFFKRGFKTVGPFVVMIYRMAMGDLLRFATIYMVFVMGFSQGNPTKTPKIQNVNITMVFSLLHHFPVL